MGLFALFPDGSVQMIHGTDKDVQRMDCESNIIFYLTSNI